MKVRGASVSRPVFLALLLAVILAYPLLLSFPELQLRAYSREDGPIEYAGAFFYFLAFMAMLAAFFASRGDDNRVFKWATRRNLYFLLLAIFFFICAGEEISWGQRIIGWDTPTAFKAVNAQRETNLHNLWLFRAKDPSGTTKSQIGLLLHPGRLIALVWLAYCFAVPLAYGLSTRARSFLDYSGLPVPPFYVGMLFLSAYLTRKILLVALDPSVPIQSPLGELQETLYAAIFFILALHFARRAWRSSEVVPVI